MMSAILTRDSRAGSEPHLPREGGDSRPLRFALLLAVFVTIISHGCHRDDVDDEPAVAPALQSERE
jgi:hypothetical protein